MKWTSLFACAAALAGSLILAGCGKKPSDARELNLYIWSDYLDPELVTQFEQQYDCKVVMSLYENNEEMLAKLQAGGASQYDIIVPSDFIVRSLVNLKLVQPIDHAKVPNMANLKPTFVNPSFDPGNEFTVAYQWGTVGLAYSKAKYPQGVTSWKDLFEPAPDVKFMYFDSEREMIGASLRYLGYSLNTLDKNELQKAADLMIGGKKRPGFMGFEGNVGGLSKVQAGTVDIAVAYNGDAFQVMVDDPNIGFVNPKEGTVVWVDSLCIPSGAPNPELAHQFINYILDAKVGAQVSNYNHFATPNAAALPMILPEDLANPAIYPTAETEKNLEYVLEMPNGSAIYGELWKTVKAR